MKKIELIGLLITSAMIGYTLGAEGLPFSKRKPRDVPDAKTQKPTPFPLRHVQIIELATGEVSRYRAEKVFDENNFGPFAQEYIVFDKGELIRKKLQGAVISESLSRSWNRIERVSVTDKEVLIWTNKTTPPQPYPEEKP